MRSTIPPVSSSLFSFIRILIFAMNYRKIILRVILLSLVVGLILASWYAWSAFPIISGYGAKNLCSAVYLQHRQPADVIREELGDFPLSLGRYTVNRADSSVTGS